MDTPQQENPAVGPTPAQIDPAVIAKLEALPSGEIDIEKLKAHMENGGVAADAAAESKTPFDKGAYVFCDERPGETGEVIGVNGNERCVMYSWGPRSDHGQGIYVDISTLKTAPKPEAAQRSIETTVEEEVTALLAEDGIEVEQAAQRPIYPIGSTAVWAEMLVVAKIIEIDGDRRRVQWKRVDDKYSSRDWVEIEKLSQSDDPATVAALAAKAEQQAHFAKGRWAIYKSPDGEIYVKIKDVSEDLKQRQITYVDLWETDPIEHWVDIAELKPVLHQEGEMALYRGHVARVEAVEEDRRQIIYLQEKEYWASDTQLKPLASDDHVGLEIAQLEINLAKQRDEMQAQLGSKEETIKGLRYETATMSDQIDKLEKQVADLTRDYDAKLKAQLLISNEIQKDLDAVRENWRRDIEARGVFLSGVYEKHEAELAMLKAQLAQQQTQRRKIETRIDRNMTAFGIAERINEGWTVVFETVIPTSYSGDYGPVSDDIHIIRYEREVQEEAHPPMEARSYIPTYEEIEAEIAAEDEELIGACDESEAEVYENGDDHPDHDSDEEDSEIPDLVHPEPVMEDPQPERKPRPVLPAQTSAPTQRIPHVRQIHQDLAGWKASQNAKLLQVGTTAYEACLDGDDPDDDVLRLTRPQPYRPGFMLIMGQAPS